MLTEIQYAQLIDNAMRGMVRDVLRSVVKSGLPGEHHFYISFRTTYPGARISDALRARYPHEITIVLQHQFWDFVVDEQQFQVTLSFGGVPEKLVIPFAALTAFADPSVKFGLQFQPPMAELSDASSDANYSMAYENDITAESDNASALGAEIISLDSFRKK